MRISVMIRDTEYRDALIEMLSEHDRDILIEVAGNSSVSRDSVILTDIQPAEIEAGSLERIRRRTVFLSSVPVSHSGSKGIGTETEGKHNSSTDNASVSVYDGCCIIFKYSCVTSIIAELSCVYSKWSGCSGSVSPSTRIIAVTGESDALSGDRCRALAGQILYRHGGSVLIIPLGYINDYRDFAGADNSCTFRRLMYMIDEGRDYAPETYTFTDSYGASYLRLPEGINPLTALDASYIEKLISSIGSHFDTVILDIGSCYSSTNLRLISRAGSILFFGSGRRISDPALYFGADSLSRLTQIGISDPASETLSLDDYVSEHFGFIGTDRADN